MYGYYTRRIRQWLITIVAVLAFPWVGTFVWIQARAAIAERQEMEQLLEENAIARETAAQEESLAAGTKDTDSQENTAVPVIVITRGDQVIRRSIEDYLPGVVACQIPAAQSAPAVWQCQAVIARTYIKSLMQGRDEIHEEELDLDTIGDRIELFGTAEHVEIGQEDSMKNHESVVWNGMSREEAIGRLLCAEQAVRETSGVVMQYHGEYILPLFHEMSGGKTRNGGDEFPYLASVICPSDRRQKDFCRAYSFSWNEFASRISRITDGGSLAADSAKGNLQVIRKDAAGYVEKLQVGGRSYTGDEIRFSLGLPSAHFSIAEEKDSIMFTVRGSGHGYGLSQAGAQAMAEREAAYDEILHYFYQDIVIEKE